MTIEGTATSGVTSLGIPPLAGFRTDMEIMSPEDIMAYVSLALGNIGKQLEAYKAYVEAKQAAAADMNKFLAFAREASGPGEDHKQFTQEQYAEFMQLLAKYPDDQGLAAAHRLLLESWGGYDNANGQRIGGRLATDDGRVSGDDLPDWPVEPDAQNGGLSASEWKRVIDSVSSSLEQLNSDNEYTMMKLQTLMQQRNQISQFSSNMLNSLHENAKAIIGNMRA